MEHTGHRERLRSRYHREGLEGFAPHEVLELLLTYAIPRIDTNPLAHALVDRFGSLSAVMEASPAELEQVPGIGKQASTLLNLLLPLFRMYAQEKLLPRRQLDTYANLSAYCHTLYLGANVEMFHVLSLDARLNLLAAHCLSQGTPSEVSIQPRAVLQELMCRNAVAAVICHNHPSGSPEPSQADIDITGEILRILDSVGIRLVDHVIVGGNKDYSFFSNGLLDGLQGGFPLSPPETRQAGDPSRHASPAKRKRK